MQRTAISSESTPHDADSCRIFVVFYASSLQQQINGNLSIYVTSSFAEHPLTATTSIVSSIVGAVAKLPIARVIDTWGRTEGYVAMIVLSTLGSYI